MFVRQQMLNIGAEAGKIADDANDVCLPGEQAVAQMRTQKARATSHQYASLQMYKVLACFSLFDTPPTRTTVRSRTTRNFCAILWVFALLGQIAGSRRRVDKTR
jgi:hypothetical protein